MNKQNKTNKIKQNKQNKTKQSKKKNSSLNKNRRTYGFNLYKKRGGATTSGFGQNPSHPGQTVEKFTSHPGLGLKGQSTYNPSTGAYSWTKVPEKGPVIAQTWGFGSVGPEAKFGPMGFNPPPVVGSRPPVGSWTGPVQYRSFVPGGTETLGFGGPGGIQKRGV